MKTARSGLWSPSRPRMARSVSKLWIWRPNALRRARMSMRARWSRSSMISPAHEPSTGVPSRMSARSGSAKPSRSIPSVIVVDSPPGITRPSTPSRSAGTRISWTWAPSRCRTRACAANPPCKASTPISAGRPNICVSRRSRPFVRSPTGDPADRLRSVRGTACFRTSFDRRRGSFFAHVAAAAIGRAGQRRADCFAWYSFQWY